MTSLYRTIIAKAWEITKRYKFLWLFGFFATLLGNAAEYKSLFKQIENIKNNSDALLNIGYQITLWGKIAQSLQNVPLINALAIILTLLFVILIAIIFIWLIIVSQTALIQSASLAENDKKVSFKESFLSSVRYFWPVFGMNLLAKLIIFLLLSLLFTPLLVILIAQGAKISMFLTLVMVVIFVPIAIIIGFVAKYAVAYIVLQKKKFWEALADGWKLFIQNWLISLEMALIVFVVNAALAFILILISVILVSPFMLLGLISGSSQVLYIIMGGAIAIIAIIFMFSAAIFSTWQNTAWTLLFIKLEKGGVFPKIVRWVAAKIAKKEN